MRAEGRPRCHVGVRTRRLRAGAWAASVAAVASLLVGCGASDQPSSDFCKSVDALSAAVLAINETPLSKSTVDALKTWAAGVRTSVTNLVDAAGSEFGDEVDAVESTAGDLADSVKAAVDRPNPDTLYAARTALSTFTTAVSDLGKAVSQSC
jgi:hypothetical protein